jgi:hypothetical protein
MSAQRWTCAAFLFGVAAAAVTAIIEARTGAALSAGLLASTLVVVLWYSWETRRLVDTQRRANELDQHPWLSATSLRIEEIGPSEGTFAFGGHGVWLPIENVGRTPAFDVNVAVDVSVPDRDSGGAPKHLQKKARDQVIVPRDQLHIRFPDIAWPGIPFRATAAVQIRYCVMDGGRGEIDLAFNCTDGNWLNGPTQYRFWMADGTSLQQ